MAWNGTNSSYLEFIERHSVTFTNLDDTAADIFGNYGVPAQPAWAFIKQDGTFTTKLGSIANADLEQLLKSL